MRVKQSEQIEYLIGVLVSTVLHLVCAVVAVAVFEGSAARATKMPEVFTVTLEGGEKLGGAMQIPKKGKEDQRPAPDAGPEKAESERKKKNGKGKLERPSIVEDPERILAEKKAQEAKKKRELALKKKKALDVKRKKEAEAKRKKEQEAKRKKEAEVKKKEAEEVRQKAEDEKKRLAEQKRQQQARRARNQRLEEVSRQLKSKYEGESYDAGGRGFGAARIGGKGMGGGTLASVEKIAYANQLQEHVKSGWRWLPGGRKLRALIMVKILPTGDIKDVSIERSSGNTKFDDSVVRAVRKASPVPPPPEKHYHDFKDVRFWFDSHEY